MSSNASSVAIVTPRKRGRPPKPIPDSLAPLEQSQLQATLMSYYTALTSATDTTGRSYIDMFMNLPSKSAYPDYYKMIRRPMSMNSIKRKIDVKEYTSVDDFRSDMRLLIDNARLYNMEGSVIYNDAGAIEHLLDRTLGTSDPLTMDEEEENESTDMDDTSQNRDDDSSSMLAPAATKTPIPKFTIKLNPK